MTNLFSVYFSISPIFNPMNFDLSGIRISVMYSSIENRDPDPGFL